VRFGAWAGLLISTHYWPDEGLFIAWLRAGRLV